MWTSPPQNPQLRHESNSARKLWRFVGGPLPAVRQFWRFASKTAVFPPKYLLRETGPLAREAVGLVAGGYLGR
jgi:hypothetical protein